MFACVRCEINPEAVLIVNSIFGECQRTVGAVYDRAYSREGSESVRDPNPSDALYGSKAKLIGIVDTASTGRPSRRTGL